MAPYREQNIDTEEFAYNIICTTRLIMLSVGVGQIEIK